MPRPVGRIDAIAAAFPAALPPGSVRADYRFRVLPAL
jgi:hypothetical protein